MSSEFSYIQDNIKTVLDRIRYAAERANRDPAEIKLIAVTKTVDMERILQALACDLTELGENRVQELCEKAEHLRKDVHWHLIGHLQTNKVKNIIDKVQLIHSVDRLELAEEIQKRAAKAGFVKEILVQVNIAQEETKFGLSAEGTLSFIKTLSRFNNLRVKGLMTIAPLSENAEDVRWVFAALRKLRIDIAKENIDNIDMDYLSMGMSNDFEVAIEEGANLVRIGTAIFGKRI